MIAKRGDAVDQQYTTKAEYYIRTEEV